MDIYLIYDKVPEMGSLKELLEQRFSNDLFSMKHWVSKPWASIPCTGIVEREHCFLAKATRRRACTGAHCRNGAKAGALQGGGEVFLLVSFSSPCFILPTCVFLCALGWNLAPLC